MSVTLTHKEPHLAIKTISADPPPTHISPPEQHPSPSYLMSFYEMFIFSSQTSVCKGQMPQS